jgi:hypothetical protein
MSDVHKCVAVVPTQSLFFFFFCFSLFFFFDACSEQGRRKQTAGNVSRVSAPKCGVPFGRRTVLFQTRDGGVCEIDALGLEKERDTPTRPVTFIRTGERAHPFFFFFF